MVFGLLFVLVLLFPMTTGSCADPQGRVAFWKLDEGSGGTAVDSAEDHDGNLMNGPQWVVGRSGSALSFDGENDYVLMPFSGGFDFDNRDFSLVVWVKTEDVYSQTQDTRILNYGGSTFNQYMLLCQNDGRVCFYIDAGAGPTNVYTNKAVDDGKWHLIVAVRDNTENCLRIYLDGEIQNITIGGAGNLRNKENTRRFTIGRRQKGGIGQTHSYFKGVVDEIAVYNRAVSGQTGIASSTTPTPSAYTLTVTKAGTGNGAVISNPAGINCGSDCTDAYARGTQVTLAATPNTNSVFPGWSGDCAGSDCTTTITLDSDKNCTAIFNRDDRKTIEEELTAGLSINVDYPGSPLVPFHDDYINIELTTSDFGDASWPDNENNIIEGFFMIAGDEALRVLDSPLQVAPRNDWIKYQDLLEEENATWPISVAGKVISVIPGAPWFVSALDIIGWSPFESPPDFDVGGPPSGAAFLALAENDYDRWKSPFNLDLNTIKLQSGALRGTGNGVKWHIPISFDSPGEREVSVYVFVKFMGSLLTFDQTIGGEYQLPIDVNMP